MTDVCREYLAGEVKPAKVGQYRYAAPRQIAAVETLDREVGRVLDAARQAGYSVVLTADHGNCDEMVDPETGKPHTQHSTHPVPCLVIDEGVSRLAEGENLSAIAPTVLQLMGLAKPEPMSGRSVILDSWSEQA